VPSENDRLLANMDALAALLRLAELLRRTNAVKWQVTEAVWRAAVQAVAAAPVPHTNDSASVSRAIRAAQSAGGRLGNSGEARFGSTKVGRHPDSSLDGARFYGDLDAASQCLAELRRLVPAEREASADQPRD
jgi:hypothetical protein